jgi:hypothetical protein
LRTFSDLVIFPTEARKAARFASKTATKLLTCISDMTDLHSCVGIGFGQRMQAGGREIDDHDIRVSASRNWLDFVTSIPPLPHGVKKAGLASDNSGVT